MFIYSAQWLSTLFETHAHHRGPHECPPQRHEFCVIQTTLEFLEIMQTDTYSWRRQVDIRSATLLWPDTRVPPNGQTATRRSSRRRCTWRGYPDFGGHQRIVRQPPCRQGVRHSQKVSVRWRRWTPKEPATKNRTWEWEILYKQNQN